MASEGGASSPPVVLFDANVLYPFHLRNLLVQCGVNQMLRPRWTDTIHDEWIRNLVQAGKATRERLIRTRDIMNRVLPDADVSSYEHWIASLTLPDTGDRHVLAAAIEGGAGTILTFNLRHFPSDALASVRPDRATPRCLSMRPHDDDPEAIAAVVDAARMNLSQTAPIHSVFVDALEQQRLPRFADRLRRS